MNRWIERLSARRLEPSVSLKLLWLSVMLIGLLAGDDAMARAGGGEGYSGGGGDSGGGGGGGSGGGEAEILLWLLMLAFHYPAIGVPLLVLFIVGMIVKSRMNPDNTTARAVKKLEQMAPPDRSKLSSITARDPGFNEGSFIERVKKVEVAVQNSWTGGAMGPVRNYLSDGLFRRFESQLGIMKFQGTRNAMADHQIHICRIHSVEQDSQFDTIHVAIEASSRDVQVPFAASDADARKKAAGAKLERYTEIWSFLRRPSARTLSAGAIEGKCPSCAAPIENAQVSRCTHCEALINSGDYDWVLAEITQPVEWHPASTGAVQGLSEIASRDSGFNRQVAEDRASYVFWRWMEAMVRGTGAPLAKCAPPQVIQQTVENTSKNAVSHFRTAVGAVNLVQCESDETTERLYAKVLWSSARSASSTPVPGVSIIVLTRAKGLVDKAGLSYARCPQCRGPLAENDATTCEYCGATLGSSSSDWVLERVAAPYELRQPRKVVSGAVSAGESGQQSPEDEGLEVPGWATPDMGNRRERLLLLMRMAAVVVSDGTVTKEERKLLKTAAKRWDVPLEAVEPILKGEIDPAEVELMRPSNPTGFLNGLISAALVDGRIDKREEALLLDVAKNVGIPAMDARNMMNGMARMARVRQNS